MRPMGTDFCHAGIVVAGKLRSAARADKGRNHERLAVRACAPLTLLSNPTSPLRHLLGMNGVQMGPGLASGACA